MRHFDLIRHWEGLRLRSYRCPAGILTIGYGHTGKVHDGQVITEAEANRLLAVDVQWAEAAVDQLVDVSINANQRSALISWVFNVGSTAAAESTLIRHLNAGHYAAVPGQLSRWVHAGSKRVPGLANRRADEIALWEAPVQQLMPVGPMQPTEPLGPLRDSRTIWAAIPAAITTAIATFKEGVADLLGLAANAASGGYGWQILNLIEKAQPTVVLLLLLVVIYARIDDHRKGRR